MASGGWTFGGGGGSSGGSGSGWSFSGGSSKGGGGGGILGTIGHAIGAVGSTLGNVGSGIVGTVENAAILPFDTKTWTNPAFWGFGSDQEKQALIQHEQKVRPYLAGMATGMIQTGRDVTADKLPTSQPFKQVTQTPGQAYSQNPFGAALNDVANIGLIAGPAAGTAGEAARAAELPNLARAADIAHTVVEPINLPLKAGRGALENAGRGALDQIAADQAAGQTSKIGWLGRQGIRMLPETQQAANIALEARGQQAVLRSLEGQPAEQVDTFLRRNGMNALADRLQTSQGAQMFTAGGEPTAHVLPGAGAAGLERTYNPIPGEGHWSQPQPSFIRQGLQLGEEPGAAPTIRPPAEPLTEGGAATIGPEHIAAASKGIQEEAANRISQVPRGEELQQYAGVRNTQGLGPMGDRLAHALSITDPVNRVYYLGRLGLSPATLVGRVFGHTALGLANPGEGSGLSYLSNALRALRGNVSDEELAGMGSRVTRTGPLVSEAANQAQDVAGETGRLGRVTGALNTAINKIPTMRAATALDNASRIGYYLSQREAGLAPEEAGMLTRRALGEFDNMSPAERDIARRLIPMYAWHRELPRVVEHFIEDQPGRAAVAMNLANEAKTANQQQGIPEGTIEIGGKDISPNFLMPYGEAGTTLKNLATLGPAPKALLGYAMGVNANNPGKSFSAPKGFEQGANIPGTTQLLEHTLPQSRLLEALTGRSDIERYSTGQPVKIGGQLEPNPSGGLTNAALSFAGLNAQDAAMARAQQARIQASLQKKQKTAQTARTHYQTGSSGKSGGWSFG